MAAKFLPYLLAGISVGGQYALIAIGYTMVYGILRLINFAHGDIFTVAGFLMVYATASLPLTISIPLVVVATVLLGIAVEKIAYKPLRTAPRMSVMISAIGMSYLLQNSMWYVTGNAPSPHQLVNIEARLASIRQLFSPLHPVCAVSARTEWNLPSMVETMMRCLPDRATSPVATQLHGRLCNEPVKKQARESFVSAVGEVFDSAEAASFIAAPLKAVIRTVRDAVASVARAVWDWIFF